MIGLSDLIGGDVSTVTGFDVCTAALLAKSTAVMTEIKLCQQTEERIDR